MHLKLMVTANRIRKGNQGGKGLNRLGPETAQNQNPHLAQSVSQMLPVMTAIPHPQSIYPDAGIMKEYQNYLALLAVSLGRCGLTTSMM